MKRRLAGVAGAALISVLCLGAAKSKPTVVFTETLPAMQAGPQAVTMIVVTYPPGAQGEPHTHPGPVFGYVLEGSVEMQLAGEPSKVYATGEAFSEPKGSVHLVSRNASTTREAKILAFLIAPPGAPVTTAVPQPGRG